MMMTRGCQGGAPLSGECSSHLCRSFEESKVLVLKSGY
ncbi:hypothetical protein BVRB_014350 [Beta vulgaris subsp. vulgaris]|uniref:Uncharacterized protein n=1 Tax=Beta vulgaris subsp. vulgaris TaxID=3555 RepID=A0A0J8B1J1_BETVV|nr:hypothetical protein BVRB_014350 [Beta vulgaris subsp. vulgaris]